MILIRNTRLVLFLLPILSRKRVTIILEYGTHFRGTVKHCFKQTNAKPFRSSVVPFTMTMYLIQVIYFDNKDNLKNVYESKIVVLKEDGIMVPPMLYKIIKCNTSDAQYASGFVFHNAKTDIKTDN